jgi:PAS domain S-box-containing protein
MFVIGDRRRIVFWNHGMQRLLGYTHDEVAGRSCWSSLAGNDPFGNRYCNEKCPVMLLASRGESVHPYRLTYRAKSGLTVSLDISVVRMTLRKSKRILLIHMVRPIEVAHPIVTEPPPAEALAAHPDARVRELTSRETEILARLARGQSSATIAGELNISPLTARNHIQHVFAKLEVHSRTEAVAFAYRMSIV